jgi:hypothetical protein
MSEEEPGKILHEVRLDVSSGLSLGGKSAYYGSIDATPLFVMVLGSVSRWGFAKETIAALLPHADRALEWIRDYGDKDGDGFVEYERLNDQGLINQGWKDSWDGINFADGTPGRAAHRALRGAGLRLRRVLGARHGWRTTLETGDSGMSSQPCGTIEGAVQRAVLDARARVLRRRPGRQESGRSIRALPIWATACGSASWMRTRHRRWPNG